MKNTIASIIVICLWVSACSNFDINEEASSPNISVDSVRLEVMDSKAKSSELSIFINLTNHGASINFWQFGFYMPATSFHKFTDINQHYNRNLIMQVCDNSNNNCTKLHYEKAADIKQSDLSQGYMNILSPTKTFPLLKRKSYIIRLLNKDKTWEGVNVSNLPQNFFFILYDKMGNSELRRIHHVPTSSSSYIIPSYNPYKIDAAINKHITMNWNKSMKYNKSIHDINIVPSPVKVQRLKGKNYILQCDVTIHDPLNNNTQVTSIISKALRDDLNIKVSIDNKKDANSNIIIKSLTDTSLVNNNPEGYILTINSNNIIIQAINSAGVYYAFQTLRQIWNHGTHKNKVVLPCVSIIDYPRFKYRGILLDTTRHFFSVPEIKSLIDLMGVHKLNTLHIHFSDDEAFRLDLPGYPTLKSIAAKRGFGLPIGPNMLLQGNLYKSYVDKIYPLADQEYNGVYNSSDIVDIIAYANANQITVIPEIDIPAHARALIKALPDKLVDPNDQSKFISEQGYTDDLLPVCTYNTSISVGPEFTKTINNIVTSIAKLFNGQTTIYAVNNEISIGGDEVSPKGWSRDTSCQGEWRNLSALQKSHKFFQLMSSLNPTIIFSGWQSFVQNTNPAMAIFEEHLRAQANNSTLSKFAVPSQRTGHVWVFNTSKPGIPQAISLCNNGYKTVLSYADKTYFDLTYTPDISEPGFNWGTKYSDTYAALSSSISASKTIQGTKFSAQKNVVGLEGALWSEHIANYSQLIYMALPKMAGLSEASWSNEAITSNKNMQVNWQSLATRLGCGKSGFLAYLTKLYGLRYRGYPNGIKFEVPSYFCESFKINESQYFD